MNITAYKCVVGKIKERAHLEDRRVIFKCNIKWDGKARCIRLPQDRNQFS